MPDLVLVDNITIYQGDDEPITWTLTDEQGNPANLAGHSVVAQVRRRRDPTSPVLHEWSAEAGNVVLAGSSVSLKVDDSESWTWSFGFYDLHLTDPVGRVRVPVRGSVTVIPAVTR